MRGDPSAEALSYKQVSRSASEPLPLSLVIVKTPCGQRVILREAKKKRRSRFAAQKAWRGIEGRRVWKVASGTWEVCGAKAAQKSDESIVAMKRGNARGAKGFYVQKETFRSNGSKPLDCKVLYGRGNPRDCRKARSRRLSAPCAHEGETVGKGEERTEVSVLQRTTETRACSPHKKEIPMTPVSHGKPCAGNPHARFEEGVSAPETPRRNALLHKGICTAKKTTCR